MALTVDSLRNLTGTGGITLDTQTGELAASALQKFKSYFNIGDARQKNTDTLIAIHHAIANDPNFAAPDVRAEAARLLGQIRTDRAISAAQVRTIVQTLDRLTQNTAEAVSSRVAARLAATMPPWAAGHERAVARFVTAHVLRLPPSADAGGYAAIDVAGRMKEALDLIGAAVTYAGNDPDLKKVLFATLGRTMVNGDNNSLASEQKVRQRIDTFRADLAAIDVRAQQSDNPAAARKLGIEFLMKLGKPVDPRVLDSLHDFSHTLPSKAFGTLGPKSSGSEIFRAIHRLAETIRTTMIQYPQGVEPLAGGDEIAPTQRYIIQRAIAELPPAAQNRLLAAFESKEGLNVCAYIVSYSSTGKGTYDYNVASYVSAYLQEQAGRPVEYPGGYDAQADIGGFSPLARCAFKPDNAISGEAAGTTALRKAILEPHGFGRSHFPGAALHAKIDAGVKSLLSGTFAAEMKKLAAGNETPTFDIDIVRNVTITLPDGTRVANDPAAARDQFARLVTGNGKATYATLSPADRTKANAFMAILMQKAETDLETGIPMALSRVPGNNAYNRIADFNLRPTRAFDISGSPAEGFTIHYLGRFYNARLDYTDEKGEPQMLEAPEKKTITSTYEMEIRISAASLDKVAAEDWSQYDETASKAILGEPGAHEDVLADHYAAIPQNFRLDCEVSAGFAIRVGARAPK